MELGTDYAERVYAGVLGKMIGVYLGRPFEGWTYERIVRELGEITGYVHERLGRPLVVADDDLSGTFGFVRALADRGYPPDLTPAQIGETWLNEIIEGRTILWWGGFGNSTEHTAFLRLKAGMLAPASGSIATNGATVAEQIGAQIFIDGWGMICPGDPERAADFARRAASVSHDGEAIHAAEVIAAMEAQAFVTPHLDTLLDVGTRSVPRDSTISRLHDDLREWHAADGDWRTTRGRVAGKYGYDRFGGNCHTVPNHALIVLGLLYGDGDFGRTLGIVNTCGWDTDCNSGNAGCILGIAHGLRAFDGAYDWRGPVADRLYVVTAEGGSTITDAVTEATALVDAARALAGQPASAPKGGARFHFSMPGSVQGFAANTANTAVTNAWCERAGARCLAIAVKGGAGDGFEDVTTPAFIPPGAFDVPGYGLLASPTLHAGQIVYARVFAAPGNTAPVRCGLVLHAYGAGDALVRVAGPEVMLAPDAAETLTWQVPERVGEPIAAVGLTVAPSDASGGTVSLDRLTWDGSPNVTLGPPPHDGTRWRRAWVNGVDQFMERGPDVYRVIQNSGTGLLIQGTRQWTDYVVRATLTPRLCTAVGIAARVQGLRRYYALLLHRDGAARLVRVCDGEHILAETRFPLRFDVPHDVRLEVVGTRIRGFVDDTVQLDAEDTEGGLAGGGVALVVTEGCLDAGAIHVRSHTPA